MHRRECLATISAGAIYPLGGCLRSSSPSRGTQETPPDDAKRTVDLDVGSDAPDGVPVSYHGEVTDPWITPSSPAAFSVTTTNDSGDDLDVQPVFVKGTSSRFGEPGIVVYNHVARDFEIEEYAPPCFPDSTDDSYVRTWESDDEHEVVFTREGWGPEPVDARSSRRETFVVADDPTVDGCFPPGTYRLEDSHTVGDSTYAVTLVLEITTL